MIMVIVIILSVLIITYIVSSIFYSQLSSQSRYASSTTFYEPGNTATSTAILNENISTSITTTTPEIELLTLYRILFYYEKILYSIKEFDTSYDIVNNIEFGFNRINFSEGGILYINVFVRNKTNYIIDLVLGLNENDKIIEAKGIVQNTSLSSQYSIKYAEDLINRLKTIMFYNIFYGDWEDVESQIISSLRSNPDYKISNINKTIIILSNIEFRALRVVINSTNPVQKIINKTYIFAEILYNTWIPVELTMYYIDNHIQIYELIEIKP